MISTHQARQWKTKRIRFSDADIKGLDSAGAIQLVAAAPLGKAVALRDVRINTSLVLNYGNVSASGIIFINDDFVWLTATEASLVSGVYTDLFKNGDGTVVLNPGNCSQVNDSVQGLTVTLTEARYTLATFLADLAAFGGIFLFVDNGGSDFIDGDSANTLDIDLSYEWIDV